MDFAAVKELVRTALHASGDGSTYNWDGREEKRILLKDVTGNYTCSIVFIRLPIAFRAGHITKAKE
jgi:hypothetical protein